MTSAILSLCLAHRCCLKIKERIRYHLEKYSEAVFLRTMLLCGVKVRTGIVFYLGYITGFTNSHIDTLREVYANLILKLAERR